MSAASVMADLKRENEANVEYQRLTSAVVEASVSVQEQPYQSESWHIAYYVMGQAVRALLEWREKQ